MVVGFFDSMQKDKNGSRVDEQIKINNVYEVYSYKKKLLETVRAYLKVKK